ncbi:glycoside hydrolase family 18 protein [Crepidotus variabilis]|uniref:Glycoside hydrolase family 18 protein n=1 Tax=Crepidotus variabilis TaxID=179855 RepID=A0A9P6E620_9AGAR|nr:glycoside hydrolase family 18 protein [Crepidotus variabilis]
MPRFTAISIKAHTTSSRPTPHVLYLVQVTLNDGTVYEIKRRFSEFIALHQGIGDEFLLPAKRSLAIAVVPYAWVNNNLIEERKKGLQAYLLLLLHESRYCEHLALRRFFTPEVFQEHLPSYPKEFTTEDVKKLEEEKGKPIAASYYPSWALWTYPPERIDFSKFDVLFFAFVTPTGTAGISWGDGTEEALKRLVSAARRSGHPTKIVLSVGGWGGSYWFSQAMSTTTNRLTLSTILTNIVALHGLDGVDIDWEYPNAPGNGIPHSPADTFNLLKFFQILRVALGPSRLISAAVAHQPWLEANGGPMKDVSAFAKELSFVNIMNYDVFGASETPGPNAPLGNLCGSSKQPMASAHAAFAQWTQAGMPASNLLLGLALYGYVSKSSAKKLTGSSTAIGCFFPHYRLAGSKVDAPLGDLSGYWGQQVAFKEIVNIGALKRNSDGTYGGANGYTMGWDDCSDTPYLFDTDRTTVVSYDDMYSIASKTQFAKASGMAGCFTWSLDQDDGLVLHNAMLSNLGR